MISTTRKTILVSTQVGFSWIWDRTKQLFTGTIWCKGMKFALIYTVVFGIPGLIINFSSFNLPFFMVFSWTILSFFNGLVAGLILAKLNKQRTMVHTNLRY